MVTKQWIHSLRELLNAELYKRVIQNERNVHGQPIPNHQSGCCSIGGHKTRSENLSVLKLFSASNSITAQWNQYISQWLKTDIISLPRAEFSCIYLQCRGLAVSTTAPFIHAWRVVDSLTWMSYINTSTSAAQSV